MTNYNWVIINPNTGKYLQNYTQHIGEPVWVEFKDCHQFVSQTDAILTCGRIVSFSDSPAKAMPWIDTQQGRLRRRLIFGEELMSEEKLSSSPFFDSYSYMLECWIEDIIMLGEISDDEDDEPDILKILELFPGESINTILEKYNTAGIKESEWWKESVERMAQMIVKLEKEDRDG